MNMTSQRLGFCYNTLMDSPLSIITLHYLYAKLKYPKNITLMYWNIPLSFVNNYFISKSDHFYGRLQQRFAAVSYIQLFPFYVKI
jgi:hypothetical protein